MRTILEAIVDASACVDSSKHGTSTLRGVALAWVDLPESDSLPERVVRVWGTDGKALVVLHVDPGKGWPEHGPIVIAPEGLKPIAQLLKRTGSEIDQRGGDVPIIAKIETWNDGFNADGQMLRERQVLWIAVPCASQGIVVPLVNGTPPDITGVMRPRQFKPGTPGPLSIGYCSAIQAALGQEGNVPVWYTDGSCALMLARGVPGREHDFGILMPIVGGDEAEPIYPWGQPAEGDAAPAATLEAIAAASEPTKPKDDDWPLPGPPPDEHDSASVF